MMATVTVNDTTVLIIFIPFPMMIPACGPQCYDTHLLALASGEVLSLNKIGTLSKEFTIHVKNNTNF